MGSKAIVFLCLFLATFLLVSSQVAASEFTETSNYPSTETTNGAVNPDAGGYPGNGGNYGGGGYPGRGGGGYPGRGGYCRYGCCGRRSYYKGGCRCCTFAGQKPDHN